MAWGDWASGATYHRGVDMTIWIMAGACRPQAAQSVGTGAPARLGG